MHLQSATREEHEEEEEEEGEHQNQKSQFPKSLYFRQLPFARNWFLFLFLSVFSFPTSSHFSARAKEEVVSSSTGTYVYSMVWYTKDQANHNNGKQVELVSQANE